VNDAFSFEKRRHDKLETIITSNDFNHFMKCVSIKAMKSIRCVLASVLFFMSLSQVYLDFSSNYGINNCDLEWRREWHKAPKCQHVLNQTQT
jgi:hypothetical protein